MTVLTIEALVSASPAFGARVQIDDATGCWVWTGPRTAQGYGTYRPGGRGTKQTTAHRVSYELLVAPIADGLHVDHLCRNPPCVNPAHLEPVTPAENVRRAFALITHCKRGHEFTPENTRIRPNGRRACRACHADQMRAQKRAKSALLGPPELRPTRGAGGRSTAAKYAGTSPCSKGCGRDLTNAPAGRAKHEKSCAGRVAS